MVTQTLQHNEGRANVHAQLLEKYPAFATNQAQATAGRTVHQLRHLTIERPLGIGYEQLEHAYATLFQRQATSPEGARVLFHEVTVQELDCYLVDCSLAGQAFEVAVYGPDHLVMDYDSPIERLKQERYQSGSDLFDKNRFYDSHEQLELASEMDSLPTSKYHLALAQLRAHLHLPYRFGMLAALVLFFYLLPLEMPLLLLITPQSADQSQGFVLVQALSALGVAYGSNRYIRSRQQFSVKGDIKRFLIGFSWCFTGVLAIESVLLAIYWIIKLLTC
ncbi:MAG: hypothetical protein EOO60_12290 [Hymenobacter sp.]|nr:MAG: hypothetical protein EOO60_12290 [Hymenobacter sp.]